MKKCIFYILLVNYIWSFLVILRDFPYYQTPFENIYTLLIDNNCLKDDIFVISNTEKYTSTKNQISQTIVLTGNLLSNNSKNKLIITKDMYLKYVTIDNKVKVKRIITTNNIYIPQFKTEFFINNFTHIYFYLSFVIISIIIIFILIKKRTQNEKNI